MHPMSDTILIIIFVSVLLIFVLVLLVIVFSIFKALKKKLPEQLKNIRESILKFDAALERVEKSIKDDFQLNRKESNENAKNNRDELAKSLTNFSNKFSNDVRNFNELLRQKFGDFAKQQTQINDQTTKNVKEVKNAVDQQLKDIRSDNTKQLEEMRRTVDEKLQKTLDQRLSQSFDTVGKQLQSVQEGLGEMKNLANDVGGLKKVLSNVKMRGSIGETQLEMLLEQILSPHQYEANVKINNHSSESVEFAIKLPGRGEPSTTMWLPIDAKFPKDKYEQLMDAYDKGDTLIIEKAKKEMESTIKKMAKDINEKYISPPDTTDFGIMFLPFEGVYAEIVRNVSLLEILQRDYKVIVTGPTTLAAILNSLQVGFKTLAIEKRSSEVWQVLGAVKKEFENFGGMMNKAQKNIQTGLNQLDDVMGKRTRAIQRKLQNVEVLPETEAKNILPEIENPSLGSDEDEA